MRQIERFPYLVTPLAGPAGEEFEDRLTSEVFPHVKIFRRNVWGVHNELQELDRDNGSRDYLWLVDVEYTGGARPGPPEMPKTLGTIARVSEIATARVRVDGTKARIDPVLADLKQGERLLWLFEDLPADHRPAIDFVAFRPPGGAASDALAAPFAELAGGEGRIVTSRAAGPEGTYWYKVSLVPDRSTGVDTVVRLECDPYHEDLDGAGIEISKPPARD